MKKQDSVYLKHILDSITRIEEYVANTITATEFAKQKIVQDAVIRQLEIIGEAAKQVSPKLCKKHAKVPWAEIIGMRNKLIHAYFGVDLEAVWKTVEKDIPKLKSQARKILKTLD